VKEDKQGTFKTSAQAVNVARKMAKTEKLVLEIFSEDNKLIETLNYKHILTSQEIYQKALSDLKLARAEKTVAKIEFDKRKIELPTYKNIDEKEELREVFLATKKIYKNKKRALRYAY